MTVLREEGCAQVQGDLFSRPLTAHQALDWLRASPARAPAARLAVISESL
jgi:EAL domain-containing protein (putative c-di-GMP-specific phosphodiesterase class I)